MEFQLFIMNRSISSLDNNATLILLRRCIIIKVSTQLKDKNKIEDDYPFNVYCIQKHL